MGALFVHRKIHPMSFASPTFFVTVFVPIRAGLDCTISCTVLTSDSRTYHLTHLPSTANQSVSRASISSHSNPEQNGLFLRTSLSKKNISAVNIIRQLYCYLCIFNINKRFRYVYLPNLLLNKYIETILCL